MYWGPGLSRKGKRGKLEDHSYSLSLLPDLLSYEQEIHTFNAMEAPAAMMHSIPSNCQSKQVLHIGCLCQVFVHNHEKSKGYKALNMPCNKMISSLHDSEPQGPI